MPYTAPANNAANFTWVGASAYTAPASNAVNFAFTPAGYTATGAAPETAFGTPASVGFVTTLGETALFGTPAGAESGIQSATGFSDTLFGSPGNALTQPATGFTSTAFGTPSPSFTASGFTGTALGTPTGSTAAGPALNVQLLLHFNGSDGSTTILDSVGGRTAWTLAGGTLQSTSAKLGSAGLSLSGSASGLKLTDTTGFDLSGAFTIEAWAKFDTIGSVNAGVFALDDGNYEVWRVDDGADGHLALFESLVGGDVDGYGNSIAGTDAVPFNTWHHIAWTRDASNVSRIWLNGVQQGSDFTMAGTVGTTDFVLGAFRIGTSNDNLDGSIDEVRVTIGTAVYTSTFTPPAAEFTYSGPTNQICDATTIGPVTGFGLAAGTQPVVADATSIAPTTGFGVPSAEKDIYFENVVALLGFETGVTTNEGPAAYLTTITSGANSVIEAGAAKFDNSGLRTTTFPGGVYLDMAFSAARPSFAAGFTVEAWVYIPTFAYGSLFEVRNTSGSGLTYAVELGTPNLYLSRQGSGFAMSSTAVTTGAWHHIAWALDGATGTSYLFLDGNLEATAVGTDTVDVSNVYVVGSPSGYAAGCDIDEFRFTANVARYTASFTPPAARFPRTADPFKVPTGFQTGGFGTPSFGTLNEASTIGQVTNFGAVEAPALIPSINSTRFGQPISPYPQTVDAAGFAPVVFGAPRLGTSHFVVNGIRETVVPLAYYAFNQTALATGTTDTLLGEPLGPWPEGVATSLYSTSFGVPFEHADPIASWSICWATGWETTGFGTPTSPHDTTGAASTLCTTRYGWPQGSQAGAFSQFGTPSLNLGQGAGGWASTYLGTPSLTYNAAGARETAFGAPGSAQGHPTLSVARRALLGAPVAFLKGSKAYSVTSRARFGQPAATRRVNRPASGWAATQLGTPSAAPKGRVWHMPPATTFGSPLMRYPA